MKLKYRRIIYLSFILAFLIIAPLVILYTAGYGYNPKKGKIEKTGILYVDSKPKGADIYINKKLSGKTEKRFPKMLPDKYLLEVKKEGYYDWKKEIEIKSNLTEFAEDIVLFKQALPINLSENQIGLFIPSPDQRKIIYTQNSSTTKDLMIFDLKNKSFEKIKSFEIKNKVDITFLNWSIENNLAVFKIKSIEGESYLTVNAQTNEIKSIARPSKDSFSTLDWGLDKDVYLFGLGQKGLYQLDLNYQKSELVVSGIIENFVFDKNNLFYINKENGNYFLNRKVFGVSDNNKIKEISKIKLPYNSDFVLQKSKTGYITILDKINRDLFILSEKAFEDENIENSIVLQEKAKDLVWSKDGSQLLFYNDFEIWTFNLLTQQKNLITRYGETVKKAMWYPQDKYLICLVGQKLQAIEAINNQAKNDTTLAEITEINDFVLEYKGQELIILGRAGNKSGIYQLTLQ